MSHNAETLKAFHDLRRELEEKEFQRQRQNQIDLDYILAARRGEPHRGEGVSPDLKARVDRMVIESKPKEEK